MLHVRRVDIIQLSATHTVNLTEARILLQMPDQVHTADPGGPCAQSNEPLAICIR